VSNCASGFEPDDGGGCEPVLPADPCPAGQLAYPGVTECQAIGDGCPADPHPQTFVADFPEAKWFVWQGYAGGDSTGSAKKPFTDVQSAIDAASDNDVIVISAGYYKGPELKIAKPLTLQGVCSAEVILAGETAMGATITIERGGGAEAVSVTLRSLQISGAGFGVRVLGANVQMSSLWIQQTGLYGVSLSNNSKPDEFSAVIEDTLIDQASGAGVIGWGYLLQMSRCQVRDTQQNPANLVHGRGIVIHPSSHPNSAEAPVIFQQGRLELTSSLIEGGFDAGVYVEGQATISTSVVRNVQLGTSLQSVGVPAAGFGIVAAQEEARGLEPTEGDAVTVSGSLIEGVWGAGVRALRAKVRVEDTVVRQMKGGSDGLCDGHGLRAIGDRFYPASITVSRSLVDGAWRSGVYGLGASIALDRSLIRDVASAPGCDTAVGFGDGVALYAQPEAAMQAKVSAEVIESRIEGASRAAIATFGQADLNIEGALLGGAIDVATSSYAELDSKYIETPTVEIDSATQCLRSDALSACSVEASQATPELFARAADGSLVDAFTGGGQALMDEPTPRDQVLVTLLGFDTVPGSIPAADGSFSLSGIPVSTPLIVVVQGPSRMGNYGFVTTAASAPGSKRMVRAPTIDAYYPKLAKALNPSMARATALVRVDQPNVIVVWNPPAFIQTAYPSASGAFVRADQGGSTSDVGTAITVGLYPGEKVADLLLFGGDPISCERHTDWGPNGQAAGGKTFGLPAFMGVMNVIDLDCTPQ